MNLVYYFHDKYMYVKWEVIKHFNDKFDPNEPKIVCARGSAPDPAGGAYDAPPDP